MLRDVVIADTSAPDVVVDPDSLEAPTAPVTQVPAAAAPVQGTQVPPAGGSAPDSVAPSGAHAAPAPAGTADRPATLDELPEEALHRTTAMAARLFDAPIALVEVLDEDREWSQSWIAEGVDPSARKISFRNGFAPVPEPVVIPDGATHPEMRESPLVTGPLGIRFFVSVPLVKHDGTTIGTLAVLDAKPREATEGDLANLRDLAALAVAQLELRQESLRTTSDALPLDRPR